MTRIVHPRHKFIHQPRRIERRRRVKHDADLHTVLIKSDNIVRMSFVLPPVMSVLLAVTHQDLVQLLDVIFVERNVLPRAEHQIHQLGVTGDFLLIASIEGLNR